MSILGLTKHNPGVLSVKELTMARSGEELLREHVARLMNDYCALLPGATRAYLKGWYFHGDLVEIDAEVWGRGDRRVKSFKLPKALLVAPESERSRSLIELARENSASAIELDRRQKQIRIEKLEIELGRLRAELATDAKLLTVEELDRSKGAMLLPQNLFSQNAAFSFHRTTAFIVAEALRTNSPQQAAIAFNYRRYFVDISVDEARAAADAWIAHSEIAGGKGYRALTEFLRTEGMAQHEELRKLKRALRASRNGWEWSAQKAYDEALRRACITHDEQRLIREWRKAQDQTVSVSKD